MQYVTNILAENQFYPDQSNVNSLLSSTVILCSGSCVMDLCQHWFKNGMSCSLDLRTILLDMFEIFITDVC